MNNKRKFDIHQGIFEYSILIFLELIATIGFIYVSFTYSLFFISLVLLGMYLIYKNIIKIIALKRKLK